MNIYCLLISRLHVNFKCSFQEVFWFVYSVTELTLNDKEKAMHHCLFHTPVEGKGGDKRAITATKRKKKKRKRGKLKGKN